MRPESILQWITLYLLEKTWPLAVECQNTYSGVVLIISCHDVKTYQLSRFWRETHALMLDIAILTHTLGQLLGIVQQ